MRKHQAVCFAIAVVLSVAGSALATSVKVDKAPGRVTFTVDNSSSFTLVCDGKVVGKTKNGKVVEAPMKKVSVAPGHFQTIFVTSDPDVDPFVDGWSNISCVTPPQPQPAE